MGGNSGFDYWQQETALYSRPHLRLRLMARLLRSLPQRRLLDVGCATAVLRDLLPPSFVYHGCDIADHARAKLPPGRFAQVDLNTSVDLSTFGDRAIDVVHVGGVLEYLDRPHDLLSGLRGLVQAGSALAVSIINFDCPHYAEPRSWHPGWVFRPHLHELRELLRGTGWQVRRQIPFRGRRRVVDRLLRWWWEWAGCDHPRTRRYARQFVLLARAR
jgi:trans-aconitate methyltransferase